MFYALLTALLFGGLYATTANTVNPPLTLPLALANGVLLFLSIFLPRRFFRYSEVDGAPTILSKLMQRAVAGSGLVLVASVIALLVCHAWSNPMALGEIYVYGLIGVILFQGVGEVVTNHAVYLQRTNQYNSNQLFAMLVGMALLLFVLILYFLAFDLAQPPNLHNYTRDLFAITLVLVGYGRALFLMAHH
ncbi:MAG TPA: hypothetical protein VFD70_30610 [Anaerolineae bacterium]|nr:hypothetical protein [Anaerolineae bacterium]